jgi:hypothetical protein
MRKGEEKAEGIALRGISEVGSGKTEVKMSTNLKF